MEALEALSRVHGDKVYLVEQINMHLLAAQLLVARVFLDVKDSLRFQEAAVVDMAEILPKVVLAVVTVVMAVFTAVEAVVVVMLLRILRALKAETAALAAVALLLFHHGNLQRRQ